MRFEIHDKKESIQQPLVFFYHSSFLSQFLVVAKMFSSGNAAISTTEEFEPSIDINMLGNKDDQ